MAPGTLLLAAAVLVLVVLAVRLEPAPSVAGGDPLPPTSVAGTDHGSDPLPLPPDVLALGDEVRALAPGGTIPLNQAIDVARREFGFIEEGQIDGYLVTLTDRDQLGGLGAERRAIWIIRASGAWDIFSVPGGPDNAAADPGPALATLGYIYVDAVTGEWLQAHFQ